jgi:hypothetical protein
MTDGFTLCFVNGCGLPGVRTVEGRQFCNKHSNSPWLCEMPEVNQQKFEVYARLLLGQEKGQKLIDNEYRGWEKMSNGVYVHPKHQKLATSYQRRTDING